MAVIAVGADHAGFPLKEDLKAWLAARGHEVKDCGPHGPEPVDYPDYARVVARAVIAGEAERGVLVCGTGIGMAIAANKVPGVRAANVTTEYEAQVSREHNDANVLALGARVLKEDEAFAIVDKWLHTAFAGGRHQRRVDKIMEIERQETQAHTK